MMQRLLSYTAMLIMMTLTNSTHIESERELLYFMEDNQSTFECFKLKMSIAYPSSEAQEPFQN